MESLLRWSIENSTSQNGSPRPPPEPREDLDPGIIDLILGKPDAVLMKEALAVGMDSTLEPEARVTALDDLEMLVEQIDNAISTPDPVRMQALWILGTAVQNNPKAQSDFLMHDPLPTFLSILTPPDSQAENPPSPQTRSKAAYALSAALKHNATALSRLGEIGGWNVLRDALQDSDITIRRKVAFLISTLLLPTFPPASEFSMSTPPTPESGPAIHMAPSPDAPTSTDTTILRHEDTVLPPGLESASTSPLAVAALRSYGVIPVLITSLISPLPHGPDADEGVDSDYAEKAAQALVTYLEAGGTLTPEEKSQLRNTVAAPQSDARETWALSERDWDALEKYVLGP